MLSLSPRPLRGVRRSLRGLHHYKKEPGIHCLRMRQKECNFSDNEDIHSAGSKQ